VCTSDGGAAAKCESCERAGTCAGAKGRSRQSTTGCTCLSAKAHTSACTEAPHTRPEAPRACPEGSRQRRARRRSGSRRRRSTGEAARSGSAGLIHKHTNTHTHNEVSGHMMLPFVASSQQDNARWQVSREQRHVRTAHTGTERWLSHFTTRGGREVPRMQETRQN
jgi:hypothetical protein